MASAGIPAAGLRFDFDQRGGGADRSTLRKEPGRPLFEAIPPGQILPQNIHAAQLARRLKTQ